MSSAACVNSYSVVYKESGNQSVEQLVKTNKSEGDKY